jgi:hypothetical protein
MAMYWVVFAFCGRSDTPLFCAVVVIGTKAYSFILSPLLALLFYLLKAFINLFFKRVARSHTASALYLLSSLATMLMLFMPEVCLYIMGNFTLGLSLLFLLGIVAAAMLWQCMSSADFLDEEEYAS